MPAQLIAFEDAMRLCREAAAGNARRWWNPMAWQCWGCVRFSKGVEDRCFNGPGNRGCRFVNRAWDRERRQRTSEPS